MLYIISSKTVEIGSHCRDKIIETTNQCDPEPLDFAWEFFSRKTAFGKSD
jgi:hypothetical protein